MLSQLKTLYCRHSPLEERVVHLLTAVILLIGLLGIVLNRFTFQYPGNFYTVSLWLKLSPFLFVFFIFSIYAEGQASARLVFFTRAYTSYYLIIIALSFAITGIQYTPFPPIDSTLARWDLALGVDTPTLLGWVAQHPELKRWLEFAYYAIDVEMFVVVFILALFKDRWPTYEFFITSLSAFVIAILIYYFFPTATPTTVFKSPYFSALQYQAATEFREIHHYLPISVSNGGIIAFPSCHVIWAILLAYSTRSKAWLFYPLLLVNLTAIPATVLLGWHYLLDVFASLLIVVICIPFAQYLRAKARS